MANRLARSTSPYLLQHKDNPVDWWEWGDDAFAEARERDVPVLLSVGYAACHWCHVMAHESFEDAEVAAYLREHFVAVKVDREERPDVDAVYMDAVTAMTGHGGWPMTAFLTPQAEPFYAGTYFPPRPVRGMPSFRQVLEAIAAAWSERRDEVVGQGQQVVRRLTDQAALPSGAAPPDEADLAVAVNLLLAEEDRQRGGFGGAPKFPPSMVCEALLRHHARTGDDRALAAVDRALEAMARGGMYDQLAGGFARYSVDADWVVPHFEKMLYDNALLLRVYLHHWRATGSATSRRVVTETATFLIDEMRTPQGGFSSALDADTVVDGPDGPHGVEGATYVWTPAQLREVLGDRDGDWAARLLSVTAAGTFEHGASTLQLRSDPDDPTRWAGVRQQLRAARDRRPQPARDDKVVTAWNGLAIAALAEAGALLDEPRWLVAAAECADLLVRLHLDDHGRLRRASRDGVAGSPSGVLEDHGDLAEGMIALAQVSGDAVWLAFAEQVLEVVLRHFGDGRGGLYDTADDAERLVRRPQDPSDNATPSGTHAAAGALLGFAALTGSLRHREAAEAALGVATVLARRAPRFAGWGLAVAEARLAGPLEVAVVGLDDDPAADELWQVALRSTSPGAVVVRGVPGTSAADEVPLLRDRPLRGGLASAYVCRGFVCDAPVTDPRALARALGARSA